MRSAQYRVPFLTRMPEVSGLVTIALTWRTGDLSIRDLFEAEAPDIDDVEALRIAIHNALVADPRLLPAWQTYCYDKRSSPSPYLDGHEVGFYDGGRHNVVVHDDPVDACADFVRREVAWFCEGPEPRTSAEVLI